MTRFEKRFRKNYDRKEPTHDYLKYWRVVRFWVKATHGISTPDLEMMLFLYSEEIFDKKKFKDFGQIMSWDKNRFDRLLRDNWIIVWRKRYKNQKTLYELSFKGKKLINTVYKKLNGEEIDEAPSNNILFRGNVSYAGKVYRNRIIEMNEAIQRQRRLSQE